MELYSAIQNVETEMEDFDGNRRGAAGAGAGLN